MREYTIINGTDKKAYRELIQFLFINSEVFFLIVNSNSLGEIQSKTNRILDQLKPYRTFCAKVTNNTQDPEVSAGGSDYLMIFDIDPEILPLLLSVDNLWEWALPFLPGELSFVKDGKVWFRSSGEKKWNSFCTDDFQDVRELMERGIELQETGAIIAGSELDICSLYSFDLSNSEKFAKIEGGDGKFLPKQMSKCDWQRLLGQHRMDLTGRNYNKYIFENAGDIHAYLEFIKLAINFSDAFSLVFFRYNKEEELSKQAQSVWECLKVLSFYNAEVDHWPGTYTGNVRHHIYHLSGYLADERAIKVLQDAKTLWNWNYPKLPMDLAFFKSGTAWFASSVHERWNAIYLEQTELVSDMRKKGIILSQVCINENEMIYHNDELIPRR